MNNKTVITVASAYEPCNCGSHIRHNNGGNYHAKWFILYNKQKGVFEYMDSSTCELVDDKRYPITEDELQQRLEDFQRVKREGWHVDIDLDLIGKFRNLDIEKIRRRARNLLNQTDKKEDILICADVLGAKLF